MVAIMSMDSKTRPRLVGAAALGQLASPASAGAAVTPAIRNALSQILERWLFERFKALTEEEIKPAG